MWTFQSRDIQNVNYSTDKLIGCWLLVLWFLTQLFPVMLAYHHLPPPMECPWNSSITKFARITANQFSTSIPWPQSMFKLVSKVEITVTIVSTCSFLSSPSRSCLLTSWARYANFTVQLCINACSFCGWLFISNLPSYWKAPQALRYQDLQSHLTRFFFSLAPLTKFIPYLALVVS